MRVEADRGLPGCAEKRFLINPIAVLCAAGQRAYYAVRLLRQHGLDARNLSGGWSTWSQRQSAAGG